MTRYFCDECGCEVTGQMIATSLDMTGKVLCHEHYQKHVEYRKKYFGAWHHYTSPRPWEIGYGKNMFNPNKKQEEK